MNNELNKTSLDTLCAALAGAMGVESPNQAAAPNETLSAYVQEKLNGAHADRLFMYNPDAIAQWVYEKYPQLFTEMTKRWGGMQMQLPEKRTLVLNSKHPLIQWLQGAEDGELSRDICAQVTDLAEMARQPLVADQMIEFLKRSNQLLTRIIGK